MQLSRLQTMIFINTYTSARGNGVLYGPAVLAAKQAVIDAYDAEYETNFPDRDAYAVKWFAAAAWQLGDIRPEDEIPFG